MMKNLSVVATNHNKQDLIILEALIIKDLKPLINIQTDDFNRTLKVF